VSDKVERLNPTRVTVEPGMPWWMISLLVAVSLFVFVPLVVN
jgi:hypothetical protein